MGCDSICGRLLHQKTVAVPDPRLVARFLLGPSRRPVRGPDLNDRLVADCITLGVAIRQPHGDLQ